MSCWQKHIVCDALYKGLLPCGTAFGGLVITLNLTLGSKNPLLVAAIQLYRRRSLWLFQGHSLPCIGYRHYHFRGQVLWPLRGCNRTKKVLSKVQWVKWKLSKVGLSFQLYYNEQPEQNFVFRPQRPHLCRRKAGSIQTHEHASRSDSEPLK